MKKNNFINNIHLKKYLDIIFSGQKNTKITNEFYNFRCNICGDSKKNHNKKRGFIITKFDTWKFKCHNCGVVLNATYWLKKYYPSYYSMYIQDILKNDIKKSDEQKTLDLQNRRKELDIRKKKKREAINVKGFVNILKGKDEIFTKAIALCKDRKIEKSIWSKWFVAIDYDYVNRLIIPFYDNNDNIYYYQARTLTDQIPKYINRLTNKDEAIYNYYNIDKSLEVVVTEGIIDSLMIDNAIAILGTSITVNMQEKIDKLKVYYLFDSDGAGVKESLKFLANRKYVFMWKKFIRDLKLPLQEKWDMNEVILYLKRDNFTFKELKKYFTKSKFDTIWI